jgi:hypothetical protein
MFVFYSHHSVTFPTLYVSTFVEDMVIRLTPNDRPVNYTKVVFLRTRFVGFLS